MVLPIAPIVAGLAKSTLSSKKEKKKSSSKTAQSFVSGSQGKKSAKEDVRSVSKTKFVPYNTSKSPSVKKPVIIKSKSLEKVERSDIIDTTNNIVSITTTLYALVEKQYQSKLARSKALKKEKDKESKEQREQNLEKKKTSFGFARGMPGAPKGTGDILSNLLLGGLSLALFDIVKNENGERKKVSNLSKSLYYLLHGLRIAFQGIKFLFKNIVLKPIKFLGNNLIVKPIKAFGSLVVNGFKAIGRGILAFGRSAIDLIRKAAGLPPLPKSQGPKPTPTPDSASRQSSRLAGIETRRYRSPGQARAGGFQLEQTRKNVSGSRFRSTARPGSLMSRSRQFGASLQTGTAFGGRASGLQRGAYRAGTSASNLLKKLFGPKTANELAAASPLLKKVSKAARGVRIPIIGPLLVGISSILANDPLDKTLFKVIGTGLGEMIGLAFGGPIGALLGGIIGEYGGDLLHILIKGGGAKGVQQKIIQDLINTKDFFLGGFSRYFKSLPQIEIDIPNWIINSIPIKKVKEFLKGINGKQVPNLFWTLNPLNWPATISKFVKAFFAGDGKETTYTGLDLQSTSESTSESSSVGGPSNANIEGSEMDLFKRLILAEAGGEGKLGMALVARSVMNRTGLIQSGKVAPGKFLAKDSTLKGVIMGENQYTPVRDGSINKSFSNAQLKKAADAIKLAKNIDSLKEELKSAGFSEDQITNLIASTGFRTPDASYDSSQDVNVVRYKGHLFNTAGNPGFTPADASISEQQDSNRSNREMRGGLTDIVPQVNLQTIGAGSGSVGKTSERGMRDGIHHAGIDIGTNKQKGWYVAFKLKGTVSDVGTFDGYGKTVVITSGDKDFLFAHLANTMVRKGQPYRGEIIGEIGNTGISYDEHLHFEVSPAGTGGYGQDEDPNPYIKYLEIGRLDPSSTRVTEAAQLAQPSTRSSQSLQRRASYEQGASQTVMIPMLDRGGGRVNLTNSSGGERLTSGDSTFNVLNSYYKAQLIGFLYKQG